MREFFAMLFSENTTSGTITPYSIWHFIYLFVIFGTAMLWTFLFKNKSQRAKDRTVKIVAYLTIGLYIADFFIMPLCDSYGYEISAWKLPFNICTLMAIMVPFVQFNPKFKKIKTPVIVLSIAASLMWMIVPASALGGQPPLSYVVFQTFMYHGFLFCWGFLSLTLGENKLHIKHCWKEFVGILIIFLIALFGNTVYPQDYNWFFIRGNGLIPGVNDFFMPIIVIAGVFAVCLCIYGIYYAIVGINYKIKKSKERKRLAKINQEENK